MGPKGGWRVGPEVTIEVFAHEEDSEHAKPGDYTRTVIIPPHEGRAGARNTRGRSKGPQPGTTFR